LEIVVLHHELGSSVADEAPADHDGRPAVLGGGEPPPPPSRWSLVIITPTTLLVASRLVAKPWTRHVVPAGCRFVRSSELVLARKRKPTLGYQRIVGELKGSASRCRRRPHAHGFGKSPRTGRHAPGLDLARIHTSTSAKFARRRFFTVETVWLQRLYMLFFIELRHSSRALRRLHT